jgi:hypothetical protein
MVSTVVSVDSVATETRTEVHLLVVHLEIGYGGLRLTFILVAFVMVTVITVCEHVYSGSYSRWKQHNPSRVITSAAGTGGYRERQDVQVV